MVCPGCNYDNSKENKSCEYCGRVLSNFQNFNEDKENPNIEIDLSKIEVLLLNMGIIIKGLAMSLFGIPILLACTYALFKEKEIMLFPFSLLGLSMTIIGLTQVVSTIIKIKTMHDIKKGKIKDNEQIRQKIELINKFEHYNDNIHTGSLYAVWFIFLICFDIMSIYLWKNGGYILFYFSLIFWISGIITLLKRVKSKKE